MPSTSKRNPRPKIVVDKSESPRDRRRDLLWLGDAFFLHIANYKPEPAQDDALGGWGTNARKPFGSTDVEADVLKAINYSTASLPAPAVKEARTYAALLYKDFGDFLCGTWAEYRRMIVKK